MNEEQYLDKIQKHLEEHNYTVYREVIPDRCFNWNQPWRVDMIIYREDIGYIGVEGKYINSTRQGTKFAQAYLQIQRYRKETYFKGLKIDKWAITFPQNYVYKDKQLDTLHFLINFFSRFNVRILVFKEYKDNSKWNYIALNPGLKGSLRLT